MNKFGKLFALMFLVSSVGLVAMDPVASDSDDDGIDGLAAAIGHTNDPATHRGMFGFGKTKQSAISPIASDASGSSASSSDISSDASKDEFMKANKNDNDASGTGASGKKEKKAKLDKKAKRTVVADAEAAMLAAHDQIIVLQGEKAAMEQQLAAAQQQLQDVTTASTTQAAALEQRAIDIADKNAQIKQLQDSIADLKALKATDSRIAKILAKLYPTPIFDLGTPGSYKYSFKKLVNYGTLPVTVAVVLAGLYKFYQKSKATAAQGDVDSQDSMQQATDSQAVEQGADQASEATQDVAGAQQVDQVVEAEQVVAVDQTVQVTETTQVVEQAVVSADQANQVAQA